MRLQAQLDECVADFFAKAAEVKALEALLQQAETALKRAKPVCARFNEVAYGKVDKALAAIRAHREGK